MHILPIIRGAMIGFAATTDVDRSKQFYVEKLGFTLVEDSPYSLVLDAGGIMIRVQKVDEISAPTYTVLGWSVSNLEETANALIGRGIELMVLEGLPQDELRIWTNPSGDKIAWFKDPEGLILSITQFKN